MSSLYTVAMAVLTVLVIVLCGLAIVPPRSVRLSLRSFERRIGTPPAAVLAAGIVGLLVGVLGIASSNVGSGEFGAVDALLTAVGAFGPLAVAVGLSSRATKRRLASATECRTGDPATGVVTVDGALQAVDGTFTVPESASDEVLTCAYALQKDRGLVSSRPAWVTITEGERTAPLAVDDGSGPVRVDEAAAHVRSGRLADRGYTISLPEGEAVPDEVESFLADVEVESPGQPNADHRLRLRPLSPGDAVTAVGKYDRVTRAGDAFWGITDGDGSAYLFAGDRESVRSLLAKRGRWLTGLGAVFTLVGGGYVTALFVL